MKPHTKIRIPYTSAVLWCYPSMTGELVLTLTTPGRVSILHVWRPEGHRRLMVGID